jgi:hypothetical protein
MLSTFQENLSVPSSRVQSCPENNHHSMLHNNPDEQRLRNCYFIRTLLSCTCITWSNCIHQYNRQYLTFMKLGESAYLHKQFTAFKTSYVHNTNMQSTLKTHAIIIILLLYTDWSRHSVMDTRWLWNYCWHNVCFVKQQVKFCNFTRWFKYGQDKLWLVYTQSVLVIFEPPCTLHFPLS